MGKILCFIYDNMADFEITFAITALNWLKKEIIMIGYEKKPITSNPGIIYLPQMTVSDAFNLDDIDGIIIPGGFNNEQREELTTLLINLNQNNKLIAAICAAPQYLAKAGILNNKKYTTTLTADYFKSQNITDFFPRGNFVDEKVVRDQNIITAIDSSFIDFAMEILDYFNGFDKNNNKLALSKYYKGL